MFTYGICDLLRFWIAIKNCGIALGGNSRLGKQHRHQSPCLGRRRCSQIPWNQPCCCSTRHSAQGWEVFVSYLLSVQALGWLFGWSKEKNVEPSSLGSSCNYQKSQELSEFWKRMAIWHKYTRRGCSGKLWLPARSHLSGRALD